MINNLYEYLRARFFSSIFYGLKPTNDLRLHFLLCVYEDQRGYYRYERAYLWLFELVWGFFEHWEMLLSFKRLKQMNKKLKKMSKRAEQISRKWVLHMIEENEE